MDKMFQDLDLSQIKVGAGSRFPAEGGANAAAAEQPTTDVDEGTAAATMPDTETAGREEQDSDDPASYTPQPERSQPNSYAPRPERSQPSSYAEQPERSQPSSYAPRPERSNAERSKYSPPPRPERNDTPRPERSTAEPGASVAGNEEGVLKVSSQSRHSAVAGAIARVLRQQDKAEVQAIGAAACYQAIKAVATARNYLLPEGIDIACVPMFTDVNIGEHERTAIRFIVTRTLLESKPVTAEQPQD